MLIYLLISEYDVTTKYKVIIKALYGNMALANKFIKVFIRCELLFTLLYYQWQDIGFEWKY